MNNVSPRQSNFGTLTFDEENGIGGFPNPPRVYSQGGAGYPAPPSAGLFSPVVGPGAKKKANGADGGKDLHMFVWSSSASPVSEGGIHVFRGGDYGNELGVGVPHTKGLSINLCYVFFCSFFPLVWYGHGHVLLPFSFVFIRFLRNFGLICHH